MNVRFDLGDRTAVVTYDPAVADPDAIRAAIDRANDSMAPDADDTGDADRILE